ncbi:MAG: hypothetical protein JOY68_09650 [Candidatus Dormibacteraeota bacterium]|nr:hypothetical protein [Candidatus Dormibacteraeota bacterium]
MIDDLDRRLAAAGIPAGRRRRIVAEFRDHQLCDPEAALGDPGDLARRFADELGTHEARSGAVLGFSVLAFSGLVYAAALAPVVTVIRPGSGGVASHLDVASWASAALAVVLVLAPQVSFVAGILAILRVVRHRDRAAIPAAETRLVIRRGSVAAAAGMLTMAALAASMLLPGGLSPLRSGASPGDTGHALIAAGASLGVAALALVLVRLRVALRIQGALAGGSGWLGDDLAGIVPLAGRLEGWQFAFLTATGAGLLVWVAGLLASDGVDGAMRGGAEAAACLVGYAVLGGYLGLRPAHPS